jgi:hypothetical protein
VRGSDKIEMIMSVQPRCWSAEAESSGRDDCGHRRGNLPQRKYGADGQDKPVDNPGFISVRTADFVRQYRASWLDRRRRSPVCGPMVTCAPRRPSEAEALSFPPIIQPHESKVDLGAALSWPRRRLGRAHNAGLPEQVPHFTP